MTDVAQFVFRALGERSGFERDDTSTIVLHYDLSIFVRNPNTNEIITRIQISFLNYTLKINHQTRREITRCPSKLIEILG